MRKAKILIIGGSHAGHQLIIELLSRYGEDVDISVIEASKAISFMSGGMALYLNDKVMDPIAISSFTEETFADRKNVHLYAYHEATKIIPDKKKVLVTNLATNEEVDFKYDKLILAIGVQTSFVDAPGNDLENIIMMRGYENAKKIKAQLEDPKVKNVVIVGNGDIGVETAQIISQVGGKRVTIVDVLDRPLAPHLDREMGDLIRSNLIQNGIEVLDNTNIMKFEGDKKVKKLITSSGDIDCDLVIQASGVLPKTDWLKGVIELDYRDWIVTNEYLETNVPDIYAVGDATQTYSIAAQKKLVISLAGAARREARYVVEHLFERIPTAVFRGVTGSSAAHIFDYYYSVAGVNSYIIENHGVQAESSYFEDTIRLAIIPEKMGNAKVYTKIFYDKTSHRIMGGAILSKHDISDLGSVISLAIDQEMTLEQLSDADFYFQNEFNRQWNIWNLAAQHALGEEPF